MTSPPGKIAVVQVSSGARCNASLPSTKRRNRKRLVNRDENRAFCFSRMRRPKRHLLIGEELARLIRTSPRALQARGRTNRKWLYWKSRAAARGAQPSWLWGWRAFCPPVCACCEGLDRQDARRSPQAGSPCPGLLTHLFDRATVSRRSEISKLFRNFDAPFPEKELRDRKCKVQHHVSSPKRRVMPTSFRVTVAGGSH